MNIRTSEGHRRCRDCANQRRRERRAAARTDANEHFYADVVHPETGEVLAEASDGGKVPEGYALRGVSQFDRLTGRWLKTDRTLEDKIQAIRDAFAGMSDEIVRLPEIAAPTELAPDLMCVYPQGDPHFGMYAWAKEAGDDFDIEIARRIMLDTIAQLMKAAPPAATAILLNLGDFFHANDSKSKTPKSGFSLDTDSRWAKVFRTGVRVQCEILEALLQKHERVIVRNNPGNHDPEAAVGLDEAMKQRFWNNDRVSFVSDVTEAHHWYHRFGRVLVGSTHGDTGKHKDLLEVMAADVPKDWGETWTRWYYVGHVHHSSTHEGRGGTVETFKTTAPSDAFHAAHGYRSGRGMRVHVFHRDGGDPDVHSVSIQNRSRPVTQ